MKHVIDYLAERKIEFSRHLSIAKMLESRLDKETVAEEFFVEIRHINTVKSGLLIHLYNIVEATMTKTMEAVGEAIVADSPRYWEERIFLEWVRAAVWSGEEKIGESAVVRLAKYGGQLASGKSPQPFPIKGEPGSWNDDAIKKVCKRLGCNLKLAEKVRRNAYERIYKDETSALSYLASRRNAIAHGACTFEEGASDLTLLELEDLAGRVLPYLEAVSESYDKFLSDKAYLVE